MKTRFFSVIAILAAAFSFVACQEEVDTLDIASSKIAVSALGDEQTISFTTNADWTVKSDAAWVTVSPESGVAGNGSVKVTIGANDSFNVRNAKITLTAGSKTTTWVVEQDFVRVFSAASEINIDSKAQALSVAVNTNETFDASSECDWITVVSTKAAPSDKTVSLSVKANTGFEARTGNVKVVAASGSNYSFKVVQDPSEDAAKLEAVYYIGNAYNTSYFDGYNTIPTAIKEYALVFATQKGQMVLAVNTVDGVLAGEYEVDAAADHSEATFSIKPATGSEKYYTTIFEGDNEILVADGVVSIEEANGSVAVSAQFADDKERVYSYTYTGALPEIQDASAGANISANFGGDYFTHFAKGQKKYDIYVYPSSTVKEGEPAIYYIGFELYADKSYDGKTLPLGKFNILPEDECKTMVDLPYANGLESYTDNASVASEYNYGDFDAEKYDAYIEAYDEGDYDTYSKIVWHNQYVQKSGTIEIGKGSVDGLYNIEFNVVLNTVTYDENYNPVYGPDVTFSRKYENVDIPITDQHQDPVEDVDQEFTYVAIQSAYQGSWLGDVYGCGANAFFVGWTNVNGVFSVQLDVQVTQSYVFEKNFNNRFCNTNLPDGTYTWSKLSPTDEEGKALDCICNCTSATYRQVKNSYTGTVAYITGGSITLADGNVSFDLVATTAAGQEFHYTGGFATSCYYFQDQSTKVNALKNAAWNPNI